MNDKIQKAKSCIKLTENGILKSQISRKNFSNFFMWITLYFLLNFSMHFLLIYFLTQNVTSLIIIPSILNTVIFIGFICVYIYYRKIIIIFENDLDVFLLDIWGYTVIIIEVLPKLLIRFNQADFHNIQLIITFGILVGIGICILATSLLIKSRILILVCIIYLLLATTYYAIPNIEIKLDKQMTLIYPGHSVFSVGLISCVCLFLKGYFNVRGKSY